MLTQPSQRATVDPAHIRDYRPERRDWTVDQEWHRYTAEEHNAWKVLFARMTQLMTDRTCDLFVRGVAELPMESNEIPNFASLSERLMRHTGWQIVAVPGMVPEEVFFEHLANRRFPSVCNIRKLDALDYQEFPDVFHDIFGHVPLLMHPVIADFAQACGAALLRAFKNNQKDLIKRIARLYWYTVEVGLVRQPNGLRSFGAAIASSEKEILFALQDDSPNRLAFDVDRVMRSDFCIYDLQHTYFVLDDLKFLTEMARNDFALLSEPLADSSVFALGQVCDTDHVLHHGLGTYHRSKAENTAATAAALTSAQSEPLPSSLTEKDLAAYDRDGFLVQSRLLSASAVDKLLHGIGRFEQQSLPGHVLEQHGKSYRAFHGCHLYDENFDALTRLPEMLAPARQILKEDVYIHQLKVNLKQAFSGEMWPWHQDYIYWRNEDQVPTDAIVSVMIFLDDITEFNGPVFFIPGSHRVGCIDSQKSTDSPAGWEGNVSASLTYQVEQAQVQQLVEQGGLFSATGNKGTAVWFHGNLVHASQANISPHSRRLVILTYNAISNAPISSGRPQRPAFLNGRDRKALKSLAADLA